MDEIENQYKKFIVPETNDFVKVQNITPNLD